MSEFLSYVFGINTRRCIVLFNHMNSISVSLQIHFQ